MIASNLNIENLVVRSRQRELLRGLHFSAEAGEIVAVFGPHGSGKSALIQCAAGQTTPDSGDVRLNGSLIGKRDGRVFVATDSVRRSTPIRLVHKSAVGTPFAQRTARVTKSLETLELYGIRDTPVKELSDGQRRAVALATGLASPAPLLLVDGLLDSLPEPIADRVWTHLQSSVLTEKSITVIATVRADIAERANKVLILDQGERLAYDDPGRLLSECAAETVTIEGVSASLVQGTLRGIFDVEVEETPDGARFSASDGVAAAAGVFRHPPEGARAVYVRRPTLWDVLQRLREEALRAAKRS